MFTRCLCRLHYLVTAIQQAIHHEGLRDLDGRLKDPP